MLNASHFFTKSAAFSQPAVVRRPSNFSTSLPFSSKTAVRFAIAPTVIPSKHTKPVTISFAYPAFNSKKKLLSLISSKASAASAASAAKSGTRRFKSSIHSSEPAVSLLFSGRIETNSRIAFNTSVSPSRIKSTFDAAFWKSADAVSNLSV